LPENIPFGKPELNLAQFTFVSKRNFVANDETRLFLSSVRVARFFKYWLPVILWMIVIFGASTNLGAPRNTSRIIGPILRWLIPNISDDAVANTQFFVRKSCHAVEYAILALLFWRARWKTNLNERRGWNWREAGIAILFSAVYAATDEFHQYFVASRQGSPWDVLLDTAGATAGILGLWKIGCWLKRWE
jgi:VanZ family protein